MEKKNYFTIGVLVFALLVLGVIGFTNRKPVVNVNTEQLEQPVVNESYGSMPGPDITSSYLSVNGLTKWYPVASAQMSSSTVSWVKCPNATTSIESLDFNILKATTTAFYYDFSTSTSRYASSSNFGNISIGASAKGIFSYREITNGSLCYPNTYIVVKAGGSYASSLVASSTLRVVLREIK